MTFPKLFPVAYFRLCDTADIIMSGTFLSKFDCFDYLKNGSCTFYRTLLIRSYNLILCVIGDNIYKEMDICL